MLRLRCSILAAACLWLMSCAPAKSAGQPGSDIKGLLKPFALEWEQLPPKPLDVLGRVGASLARTTSHGAPAIQGPIQRAALQASLFAEINALGGIHPDDLHFILRQLVADEGPACGGQSCARAFGFDQQGVNHELDLAAAVVAADPRLALPEQAALKRQLSASLGRTDLGAMLKSWREALPGALARQTTLDGTCAAGTRAAFGLRTAEAFRLFAHTLRAWPGSVDFRKSGPRPFQGRTGACHLYALAELFAHSPRNELIQTRAIDIQRTFVEIWTENWGGGIEQALARERNLMANLEQARQRYRTTNPAESPRQSFDRFIRKYSLGIRYAFHGGYGKDDFNYLRLHGAVSAKSGLPTITTDELEALGEQLAIARLRLLESWAFHGQSLPEGQFEALLRPALTRVFQLAAESKAAERQVVKDELARRRLVYQIFDGGDPAQVGAFLRDLRRQGPLYIEGRGHATTVVGYDSVKRLFYIRDSDDPLERTYVEVDADELFNYLKAYAYLT